MSNFVLRLLLQDETTELQQFFHERNHVLYSSDDEDDDMEEQLLLAMLDDSTENMPEKQHESGNLYVYQMLKQYDEQKFQEEFRVSRQDFEKLILQFTESKYYQDLNSGRASSPTVHMALFLYFAAHERCTMRHLSRKFKVSIGKANYCLNRVSQFLTNLSEHHIKWPDLQEQCVSSKYFESKYGLPGAIGVIDGLHVKIASGKPLFINRQGLPTIHVQAICNEQHKFIHISLGQPGSVSDYFVYQQSAIAHTLPALCKAPETYIIGDSAYACSSCLITPYINNVHVDNKKLHFNRALLAAKNIMTEAFYMLQLRFPQLKNCKLQDSANICNFITSCFVLYNMCEVPLCVNVSALLRGISQAKDESDEVAIHEENDVLERDRLCEQLCENRVFI